jgi:hypothetical protein
MKKCTTYTIGKTTIKKDYESDGGKEYIDEIIRDLKAENKAELLKMGFSEKETDASLNDAEEVE